MRVFSWNVANRVKKQPLQLEALLARNPDVIGLQEVTKKTAQMWNEGLSQAGYSHILTTFETSPTPEDLVGPRRYGLLIASRWPLKVLDQQGLEMPWMERLLSVLVHSPGLDFEFHTSHIPPGASHDWLKIETFEGIYNYLAKHSEIHRILCGDFNSPKQELKDGRTVMWGQDLLGNGEITNNDEDRWQAGERSVIRGLAEYDLPDVYRELNGWEAEDYSFVVWRKGKIVSQRRFDHIFASRELNPVNCRYLHDVREIGLSDHSAIGVEFDI